MGSLWNELRDWLWIMAQPVIFLIGLALGLVTMLAVMLATGLIGAALLFGFRAAWGGLWG